MKTFFRWREEKVDLQASFALGQYFQSDDAEDFWANVWIHLYLSIKLFLNMNFRDMFLSDQWGAAWVPQDWSYYLLS